MINTTGIMELVLFIVISIFSLDFISGKNIYNNILSINNEIENKNKKNVFYLFYLLTFITVIYCSFILVQKYISFNFNVETVKYFTIITISTFIIGLISLYTDSLIGRVNQYTLNYILLINLYSTFKLIKTKEEMLFLVFSIIILLIISLIYYKDKNVGHSDLSALAIIYIPYTIIENKLEILFWHILIILFSQIYITRKIVPFILLPLPFFLYFILKNGNF